MSLVRNFACLIGLTFVVMLATESFSLVDSLASQPQSKTARANDRHRYEIRLNLDFDALSYTGLQRVRWINRGDRSTSVVYFHLYSNLRVEPGAEDYEPRIEISGVHAASTEAKLAFTLDDQNTTLRVYLGEAVPPGKAAEIVIKFAGRVPEIDPEETGLTTHVIKQVSAAVRGEREIRRARELNFRCRGVMMLATAFPVLVVQDGDDWRRKLEPSVGDTVFNEAADYEITVEAAPGVSVHTAALERSRDENVRTFSATALRDLAIIAGRNLQLKQTKVGDLTVRSIFVPEHEKVANQVLTSATEAVRIFTTRFGPLPFEAITIAEVPLVAGLGSAEFAAFSVIASAFYVDFDSPVMRNLPEIIREQRPALEESLEWTVAHLVAHQWWGAAVGNDPARHPVLDEALSSWSAYLYYNERYGEKKAAAILEDQVKGVYRVYRTFGGEDMNADRPAREYRNSLQYAAIVTTKGALMFLELQRLLGDARFFAALQSYYKANLFEIADLDDLRGAMIAEAPLEQRRTVARTFNRWLSSRRGDEDIAPPDSELAATLGLPRPNASRVGERNAFTPFARLGKFFWQQMTRIR
ncbi:MAG TPA: M1 family aminopeptidase [Pyrinomonadaceae bacterium]|nr:M1 family aminopeptidase [Pyrinomonadaceae bacterium]